MQGEWWSVYSGEPLKITILEDEDHGWECDICDVPLKVGEPLYLQFSYCHDAEMVMAHIACKDNSSECPNCQGRGWVRIPGVPADTLGGLLGIGIRSTEQCPVCNGDKFISNTTVMGQVVPITKEIDK